jgi:hypothetical protein
MLPGFRNLQLRDINISTRRCSIVN